MIFNCFIAMISSKSMAMFLIGVKLFNMIFWLLIEIVEKTESLRLYICNNGTLQTLPLSVVRKDENEKEICEMWLTFTTSISSIRVLFYTAFSSSHGMFTPSTFQDFGMFFILSFSSIVMPMPVVIHFTVFFKNISAVVATKWILPLAIMLEFTCQITIAWYCTPFCSS